MTVPRLTAEQRARASDARDRLGLRAAYAQRKDIPRTAANTASACPSATGLLLPMVRIVRTNMAIASSSVKLGGRQTTPFSSSLRPTLNPCTKPLTYAMHPASSSERSLAVHHASSSFPVGAAAWTVGVKPRKQISAAHTFQRPADI